MRQRNWSAVAMCVGGCCCEQKGANAVAVRGRSGAGERARVGVGVMLVFSCAQGSMFVVVAAKSVHGVLLWRHGLAGEKKGCERTVGHWFVGGSSAEERGCAMRGIVLVLCWCVGALRTEA